MVRDPLIGQVVGDYRLEEVIGSGAMGIVYRALNEMIGKMVAIKVLKPEIADDPDMVARLVREARTVNAIHHPGIVDIFGFGTLHTGQAYVVMDLLVGEPLELWVRREAPAPVATVAGLIDELLSALGAAHEVGVIHRDLKPGNVFLEKQREGGPKVKLLDFGLARQANRAQGSVRPTSPGTLLGTPAFMAPEQVMGQKTTPATDLYALGGIAYQMLTGHLPHEAASAVEVLSQKMLHDPTKPRQLRPDLDEELERWLLTLLMREPVSRFQTATEARQKLKSIIARAKPKNATPAPKKASVARAWQEARTVIAPDATPTEPRRGPVGTGMSDKTDPSPARGELLGEVTLPAMAPLPSEPAPRSSNSKPPSAVPTQQAKGQNNYPPPLHMQVTMPFQEPLDKDVEATAVIDRRRPANPLYVPRSRLPYILVGVLAGLVLLAIIIAVVR